MKLKWVKGNDVGKWHTADGRYKVWRQAQVRWGSTYESEYAASCDDGPWLVSCAATAKAAKQVCQEHAGKKKS